MNDTPEPIPTGVYFRKDHANFYYADTQRGCGDDFYLKWRPPAAWSSAQRLRARRKEG